MAYSRTAYDHRPPSEVERKPQFWDTLSRPYHPQPPPVSNSTWSAPTVFEPESEFSDVSDNPGEDPQTKAQSSYPVPPPHPPSNQALESPDAIQSRLRELQRVEDVNIKRQDFLKAKRARKDDRIRQKRETQDLRIKAIMDARVRRDERITHRRRREDEAFDRADRELEDEENNLRRRLKRLKRGLPVDDIINSDRQVSASMSPPGPAFSNVPHPPKRHQTGPPGANDSSSTSESRSVPQGGAQSAPAPGGPTVPSYSFMHAPHISQTSPYHQQQQQQQQHPLQHQHQQPPAYSHSPPAGAVNALPPPPPHSMHSPSQPNLPAVNGHPASPHTSQPQMMPLNPIPNPVPTRHSSSNYDTRPPPATSSGFASINAPPSSGFSAINPRAPVMPVPQGLSPAHEKRGGGSDAKFHDKQASLHRSNTNESSPGTPSSILNTGGKRTPSSTHPYQMSEAFANRHHHCERTDALHRGIWTYYGQGGTEETPTATPTEMYLQCNHDGCRRIDWRTVHGLQCHIVKNHEQPKGTIGSLEKALDRYGIAVATIEAYEREHGEGSAGHSGDSKNVKIKAKTRELSERPEGQRRWADNPAQQPAPAFRPNPMIHPTDHSPSPQTTPAVKTEISPDSERRSPGQPLLGRFASVNAAWSATMPTGQAMTPRDHEMKDAPLPPATSPSTAIPANPTASVIPGTPIRDATQRSQPDDSKNATSHAPIVGPSILSPAAPSAPALTERTATSETITPAKSNTEQTSIPLKTPQGEPPTKETAPSGQSSVGEKNVSTPNEEPLVTGIADGEDHKPAIEEHKSVVEPRSEPIVKENEIEQREKEKPKVEKPETQFSSPQVPDTPNRPIGMGTRRGSSRRSSLAANKIAEKEKEEAAERERERERERIAEQAEDNPPHEDDDEDRREKDKNDPTKTPPRRTANGRFVRKTR